MNTAARTAAAEVIAQLVLSNEETASVMQEMMTVWNRISSAAKDQFPSASAEELYQITKGAMNSSLGLA